MPSLEFEHPFEPEEHGFTDPLEQLAYLRAYRDGQTAGAILVGHETAQQFIDDKTGLLNEKGFDALYTARENTVLLYADIKDFKAVNDTYGHSEGDAVLRGIGSVIGDSLRAGDVAARIHGDEFLGLLNPHTHGSHRHNDAPLEKRQQSINERIAAQMEAYLEINPKLRELGIDISVGTIIVQAGESLEDAKSRAEALMYEHKHRQQAASGRAYR